MLLLLNCFLFLRLSINLLFSWKNRHWKWDDKFFLISKWDGTLKRIKGRALEPFKCDFSTLGPLRLKL